MTPPSAGPAPDEGRLQEAALAHLARYAATQAGLLRVLDRRIDRWARRAEAAGEAAEDVAAISTRAHAAAREVAARLAAAGAVDDAAFAETRARSLTRAGRSRLAVAAHLAGKGVPTELAQAALPDDPDSQLAAALATARRRRIGPFRRGEDEDGAAAKDMELRELGVLARAGFPQELARRALAMERDEAESLIIALRQG